MNKYEKIVISKYKKLIRRSLARKYRNMAKREAENKRIYLANKNVQQQLKKIESEIYQSYMPVMETEVEIRIQEAIESPRFQKAVEKQKEFLKKRLSFKQLKDYQACPINIPLRFLEILSEEMGENDISLQNLKYLIFVIIYGILKKIKEGYKVKFGNLFYIWCDKRDLRCNLPEAKERILEDRLFPKFKFSKSFDRRLFNRINDDNEAIKEFYRQKAERLFKRLKIRGYSSEKE